MKFLITFAFKNLTRYKRRTLITAGAIAVGIMMYIFIDAMLMGAEYESVRNLKWYETASARILNDEYWENRQQLPLDLSISDPDKIIDRLDENGIIATKRISIGGDLILSSQEFGEDGNLPVTVTAIDPSTDNEVFHYADTLIEGRFLEQDEDAALIGSWFAEDIGAKIGSWVTVLARGNGGFYEAIDLEIVGILNCPNPNVNRTLLMIPFDTADYYLAMDGAATEINIKLSDLADVDAELPAIQELLNGDDLTVMSWTAMARDYLALAEAKRGGTGMILFLIFIIAAVGISNTMLMAIFERVRELGMMRSLGMSDAKIRIAFMLEAAGIGLLGSIMGVILGIVADFFIINVGIDFSFIMRDMDIGYRIQGIFRGAWNPGTIVIAFFAGILISTLVAYLPTNRALKMDIPSCLRHQ